MNKKYSVLDTIGKAKIIAVIRVDEEEKVLKTVEALHIGGISVFELTMTSPYPHRLLESVSRKFRKEIVLGAGSVFDSESARLAILSGADFIVSPLFDEETAKTCNRYCVPYIPGINSPTEIKTAIDYGVDVVKLFPAGEYSYDYIKHLKGPFPNIHVLPTGGINALQMIKWFEAGVFACGIGGELLNGLKEENYPLITENAKKFVSAIENRSVKK